MQSGAKVKESGNATGGLGPLVTRILFVMNLDLLQASVTFTETTQLVGLPTNGGVKTGLAIELLEKLPPHDEVHS